MNPIHAMNPSQVGSFNLPWSGGRGHGPGASAFCNTRAFSAMTRSLREVRREAILNNSNGFPYSR